ncbi:MAG: tRNA (N(6)-L-threonylcarbamoyladenosine(37)-C(2))-methylthiotransferase MtaB [Anaerolineae bacterium]|nr:tRNA (N(6)-L-threonylcarbamoyladenosine(37)-C(2))-methylthiotransferase MtaB [Anaerolineae bacterium]MDW8068106.1 tRNA (N(6)-L-threonylcarbamoyladenosine(37)-C(2))-methylthiotransferase MtaB [Anaerolineae bacterium]
MASFYFQSLGCRLNQSELEALARQLAARGHRVVDDPAQADICVVNTCAVTAEAERKTRHLLRALARANPRARIAVLGCAATLRPEELASFPNVAWVIPNEEKERAAETLALTPTPLPPSPSPALRERERGWPEGPGEGVRARTRAFVKIQDGCDNACTYCIVHLLRGPVRSRPPEEVVAEIAARVREGYQEAVLTGVNIGAYGRDLGLKSGLAALVAAILARTDLPRLRLSSVEPWDVDESLLALWADPRLCRQLHLPLQSGCEATLQRMGRRMTAAAYAHLVERIRAAVPEMAITTDIIVGFPGEDETEFAESLAFVERMAFARLHVFPFSPRPGTPAAWMEGRVPEPVVRERAARMRELGEHLAARYRRQFLGREMDVLWERRRRDGRWHGLTDNYLQVVTSCPADLHNRITRTRLVQEDDGLLVGEVI